MSVNAPTRPAITIGTFASDAGEWPQHVGDVLERACALAPETSIVSLHENNAPIILDYMTLRSEAMQILAGLRRLGMQPGQPLILQLDRVDEFLPVFWAAQFGGFLPAPLAVPFAYDAAGAACARLEAAWLHLDRPLIVAGSSNAAGLAGFAAGRSGCRAVPIIELRSDNAEHRVHQPAPDDPALLLFTSGSTGAAKAVIQTHRALIARSYGTIAQHGFGPADKSFNWFPLDHVGGLVMFHLLDTCALATQVHAPTSWVLQDPLRWLDVLENHAITVTWAPNFAFGLVNARREDIARQHWNLSRVRHILNGGEAIVARTAREFLTLLAPHALRPDAMFPAWGMSETCSGVTYSDRFRCDTASDTDPFVEVGRPIPGFAIRIVDAAGSVLPEHEIGQLEVSGPMVTCGYYQNPELNETTFTADGWFRTGDNGFLADGRLTVTGRDKDEIIAHGVNHHCHEIEKTVEEVAGVDPSFAAAIGIRESGSDTDQLIVFFVPLEGDGAEIARAVRRHVAEATGLFPRHVVPVAREDIPKTAIGKIQRAKLKADFVKCKFAAAMAHVEAERQIDSRYNTTEQMVASIWCDVLGLATVGPEEQFFEVGGNSVALVQVHARLESQFDKHFSPVELFRFPTVRALARFLAGGAEQSKSGRSRRRDDSGPRDDVAVVGMACRFPGAPDIDSFWRNLCQGIDSIASLDDATVRAAGVAPARASDPRWVKAAPCIDGIADFDADFFGMTVKEARLTDPQHRIFLECCWEALEDAGTDPLGVRGACGVFAGASLNTYFVNNVFPNRHRLASEEPIDSMNFDSMDGFQLMVTSDKDYLPTRASFKLNLTGPSVAVQTACSTSLVAIHLACRSLLSGDCDMALAGGATVKVPQDSGYLYAPGMMLSPDGHCRAFDADAHGTLFGNGVGVVVLKRLADALAGGDRIYAVVKGSAVSNDGGAKVGYTAPSEDGQFRAIADAIADAGVPAESIGLVEAHGTATELGDPIEVAALTRAFRAGGATGAGWCALGSVKTNIGHAQHASGVAGFIKAALALHHRRLPASLHFNRPNPRLALESSPFHVNTELVEWTAPGPLRAGVNSLGIGGTNCHVILEQAPGPPPRGDDARPANLLVLSARNQEALAAQAARFTAKLNDPQLEIGDTCHTAATGRHPFEYRLAVVGTGRDELAGALADPARWQRGRAGTPPRIAWLFTGQGAQWFGMARELYETEPLVRGVLDRSQQVLADELDRPLLSVIFGDPANQELLQQTAYTQPALYAVECALAALWLSWGVKPAAVIGHSVGEYAAAHVAGILGLDEGLRLLALRGRLIQALPQDGAMAAVFADEATVRAAIAGRDSVLALAAVNGSASCVISGQANAVAAVSQAFAANGIRTQKLAVSHAFHSPLLDPMLRPFRDALEKLELRQPNLPLVSNLSGGVAGEEIVTPDYWVRHAREPVRFVDGIDAMGRLGCDAWLEVGPRPTLLGLARASLAGADDTLFLPSIRPGTGEWHQMLSSLGALWTVGASVEWQAVDRGRDRRRVSLPTYPFQRQRHWIDAAPATQADQPLPLAHKLAGRRISTPLADVLFEARVGLDLLPWLADHRVHDQPVLPAAAYIEAAVAGFAELTGPHATVELRDVSFERPFIVTATAGALQSVFSPAGDGVYAIAIHRRDGETWHRHMTGRVQQASETPAAVALATLLAACPDVVSLDRHFARFTARGIEYGPAFQGLTELRAGQGRAIGHVRAPQSIRSELAEFRLHPAILDACLQVLAAAFPADGDQRTLLPIALEHAVLSDVASPDLWCHAIARPARSNDIIAADLQLIAPDGRIVASLNGVTLKSDTRREAAIDGWFFRPVWRPLPRAVRGFPGEGASDAAVVAAMRPALLRQIAAVPESHCRDIQSRDVIAAGFIAAALDKLGVPLRPGAYFTTGSAADQAGVVPEHKRLFAHLLGVLAEAGQLSPRDDGWSVPQSRPALPDPSATLAARRPDADPGLSLMQRCGPALADVLTGRCDALRDLLYAGDGALLARFYAEAPGFAAMNATLRELIAHLVAQLPQGRVLEVLEIGAGTGATTSAILPALPADKARYTFTDVSRSFFDAARERFGTGPALRYQTLDIEQDPQTQGFARGGFDLIIAANALHATRDLTETLGHVRTLLAPQGKLVLLEVTRPMAWVDIVFGLTRGWWRFADSDLRGNYPLLPVGRWCELLTAHGFDTAVAMAPDPRDAASHAAIYHQSIIMAGASAGQPGGSWLLLADRQGVADGLVPLFAASGDAPVTVHQGAGVEARGGFVMDPDTPDMSGRLVALLRDRDIRGVAYLWPLDLTDADPETGAAMENASRQALAGALHLVQALVRSGPIPLTIVTRNAVAAGENGLCAPAQSPLWGFARTVALEHPELHCRCIDLDREDPDPAVLFAELTTASDEDQVALRHGERLVARLAGGSREPPGALQMPDGESYRLTARAGDLDSLGLEPATRRAPESGEIEVRVMATGLNFRDVLSALGQYQGAPAPLGVECAGEVVNVGPGVDDIRAGDRVMAIVPGSFTKFATFDARAAAQIPDALRYEEAATIPAAFVTAWHGLYELGGLKPGHRVLIHAATGGVGQAALQLAHRVGAKIYGTASRPKWDVLRGLGVEAVFDSRSLDFADGVMRATNGEGVDLVLNSLNGEFIRKGLEVVASGGRFVEIGRNAVWSKEQVAALRPDIAYHVLDLGDAAFSGTRLRQVAASLAAGEITPLPRQAFALADAPTAFRRMQRASHTGKLVVLHPQPVTCRAQGAYLITGGLGGLGSLTAAWLVERGARHLVLAGRNAASAASPQLEALRAAGADIALETVDVSRYDDMAAMFARLDRRGLPLRGFVHAAGALDDGVLTQLTVERLRRVTAAKIAGAWNLHLLTRDRPLDMFVLYASAVSLFGAAGQANHAAANTFLDALAAFRRSHGLPGLSIDWGPWSEAGAAAEHGVVDRLGSRGFGPIGNADGIAALARALGDPGAQVGIVPIDWQRFLEARPPWPFVTDFRPAMQQPVARRPAAPAVFDRVRAARPEDRHQQIADAVAAVAARVLGHNDPRRIDRQAGFFDIGFDSLTTVELRVLLQNALSVALPATVAFDYPTVDALASHLHGRLFPESMPEPDAEAGLAALSADDVEAELRRELEELRY